MSPMKPDQVLIPTSSADSLAIAVPLSRDAKIGFAAATHASQVSCPTDCPIKSQCYANFGTQNVTTMRLNRADAAWRATINRAVTPLDVARVEAYQIDTLRSRLDLRLHVVGDCVTAACARVVASAAVRYARRTGARVWTYTHAWRKVARKAWQTVSVLASVESLADARRAMRRGYAAAVIVPALPASGKAWKDGNGGDAVTVIPCPNQVAKERGDTLPVTCVECRLCLDDAALLKRRAVIAFAPHSTKKRDLLRVIQA